MKFIIKYKNILKKQTKKFKKIIKKGDNYISY